MQVTAAQHPTVAELADFASGKLDPTAAQWVARHLSSCLDCQSVTKNISTNNLTDRLHGTGSAGVASPGAETPSTTRPAAHGGPPKSSEVMTDDDVPPALRDHPRYRIIRKLGQGGMGVVYQAEHRMMQRLVAVKVINHALLDNPEAVERFNREVRAAAKLDHANIVKAHDAEKAGDLQLLVMEYVEGLSLSEVLAKKGQLPIVNACNYIRQAALGLQHAHERGMIHRDLKPHNLMLTPKGVVKILDFGLAKLVSEHTTHGGLTHTDAMLGTPQYLAPEQALNTRSADIRADIYSLGCTLFCMLAGHPPFAGESALQIIIAHKEKIPPNLKRLRPDVPAELAFVVARMLAKPRSQRPQTPKEVADALAPFAKPVPMPTAKAEAPQSSPTKSVNENIAPPRVARYRWPSLLTLLIGAGVLLCATVAGVMLASKKKVDAQMGNAVTDLRKSPQDQSADGRRFWRFAVVNGDGYFEREPDGTWVEKNQRGTHIQGTWQELGRTPEYVELYDPVRKYKTRLGAGKAWLAKGMDGEYGPSPHGDWEVPGGGATVVAESKDAEKQERRAANRENTKKTPSAPTLKQLDPPKATDERSVFLTDLSEYGVSAFFFQRGGGDTRVKGALTPHGLLLQPPGDSYSRVSYRLGRQFKRFQATAAISDVANGGAGSGSPLVFQVFGDGKLLWESSPIQKVRVVRECDVSVAGVESIELRVVCRGTGFCAHAVWVEPRLLR